MNFFLKKKAKTITNASQVVKNPNNANIKSIKQSNMITHELETVEKPKTQNQLLQNIQQLKF